ncbi:hypothetical protein PENTCL1PPCAC_2288 [Pristionchus entomophagus]|uniref:Mma-1 n=1 Tax=Pristionchus entomophagus TaxID=358040 RepID=A0AAV5SHF0_9BILA|nr:hypothetical protein PENTCL1PPCAC_2288 [Pristionchus entomophagus]
MLRRAAPLVRSLRSTTTVVQSSTSSSDGQNGAGNGNRGGYGRNERRGGSQRRGQTNPFQQSHMDEHTQLLKKHGDTIGNNDMKSLSDAMERINWYTSVSKMTVENVAKMLMKASIDELNGISDRSMATLLSSFGELCKEMKRHDKKELLEKIVKDLSQKDYTLGPSTRTSIFTTKVDNYQTVEELPSIVDELSAWESAGITPTEDLLVQAARVYAIQGDRKGVIELTNYARETLGRVEVRFLEWLAYSMISCGESNGIIAIEKLSRSAPDSSSRLWLTGALAAANKANLEMTVECLSRIPLSSGLSHSDKNGPVVDVLVQLIEREVEGAEQALSGYLSLNGDGSSLRQRHPSNDIVVFKARRAANERKMEVATRLYALAHDMQKNKMVESELKRGVGEMGSKGDKSVEEVRRCAIRLEQSGVIEDANAFLLNSLEGEKLMEFVLHLRSTQSLSQAVSKSYLHKFALASKLIKTSSSSSLSLTTCVAAILCHTGGLNSFNDDRQDIERMIFNAAQDDPEVVRNALEELAESNMADAESLGGHIITAALSRIANEDDVLTSGRIEKIISSPNIPSIRLSALENKLVRIIRLAGKNEESTNKGLEMVAGIIIAAFKTEGRKDYQMISLINLIGNTYIQDEKIEKLVKTLSREPAVGINQNLMEKAVRGLEERGLKKRRQLIGSLQKQSQAYARWLMSTP